MIANLDLFGASSDYMNEKENRNEFLRLMDKEGGVRHTYTMFGRWSVFDENVSRAGKYYMVAPPRNGEHSEGLERESRDEGTDDYKDFLESMAGWSRQVVVDLLGGDEDIDSTSGIHERDL